MDLVVKISNDYTAENTFAQIINPDSISFSTELVNSGQMNFKISLADPQINEIIEFRKVAVYEIKEGADNLLWSGYISEIENDFAYATVRCQDEKDFLSNKIIANDKNWTLVSLDVVLTAIISEINSRLGINEGTFSYSTNSGGLTVNKTFNSGTSIFDILKEITDLLKLEWKVYFNQIIVQTTIGIDRTISGADFLQFIWNNESPNENNITKFKNLRRGREVATYVVGRSSDGTTANITGDTSIFGSIERPISMNNGDVILQTQKYVDAHEVSQIERDFEVIVNEDLAKNIEVGDMVKIKIIHGSILADADESVKVIQKSLIFENKVPTTTLKLSTETKEVTSMPAFLGALNRRIKRLEL